MQVMTGDWNNVQDVAKITKGVCDDKVNTKLRLSEEKGKTKGGLLPFIKLWET